MQRFEQARVDLEQSILLEPDSHESHFLLGLTHQELFRFDLALIELLRAVELDAKHFLYLDWFSDVYFSLQDYQQALAARRLR